MPGVSRKVLSIAGAGGVLSLGLLFWAWQEHRSPGSPTEVPAAPPEVTTDRPRKSPAVNESDPSRRTGGRDVASEKIPGRSSNRRVRMLADKLAKVFEKDPSLLAEQLSDPDLGPAAEQIGRDLIALYPGRTSELLEAFKGVKPFELSSNLCADLIADATKRLGATQAYTLANGLDPGARREQAFAQLGASLKPAEFADLIAKSRTDGFSEDVTQLESALAERANRFDSRDLAVLMSMELSPQAAAAVRGAYGEQRVAEVGRDRALADAAGLPSSQGADAIRAILRRGAMQDQGETWLLEKLDSLDPSILPDRSALTVGAAQRMLAQDGPAAMNWAGGIQDQDLRDATLAGAMQSWLQSNSSAAGSWVNAQPSGPARDVALSSTARFLATRGDPEAARQALGQMTDPKRRADSSRQIEAILKGSGHH